MSCLDYMQYIYIYILYLFKYNAHLCRMRTKFFVGVFGTKCCALYLNKYGTFIKVKHYT